VILASWAVLKRIQSREPDSGALQAGVRDYALTHGRFSGQMPLLTRCLVGGAQEDLEQSVGLRTLLAVVAKFMIAQACVGIEREQF